MADRYDAVVIGGGVTGLAVAFELSRLSFGRVAVIEKSYTGAGASGRNVGRIRAMQLSEPLARLAHAAQRKHSRLGRDLGSNTLFWRAGYAWLLYDDEELERIVSILPMLRTLGIAAELHGPARTVELLPVLKGGERPAGALVGRDAIVHHDAVIHAYRRRCAAAGITLMEQCEAVDVSRAAGGITGVSIRTGAGVRELATPIVVNATEGWSTHVSTLVGLHVPNRCIRHEVLVTEPVRPFMTAAVTFYRPVEGWFNQTLRGEMVAGVGDPAEPEGLNHNSTFAFLSRTAQVLLRKAPRLGPLKVIRQWAGVYDMTPDRLPIVGPVVSVPGFFQCNGYSGRGMAVAPLLAELLARLIARGEDHEFLRLCDPQRFEGAAAAAPLESDYYAPYPRANASTARSGPHE